jgi:hypothetical protein
MRALVHRLEAELLPELERRCALLQHDQRFARTVLVSDFDLKDCYVWRLDCHSRDNSADWTRLSLQAAMIFAGEEVALQGMVDWHFPRACGELSCRGHEYSTRAIHGLPDDSIPSFVSELPALLKAFDEVVARGRPEAAA